MVATVLQQVKVMYLSEFTFYYCRDIKPLPFDFAVFTDTSQKKPEYLIEYDGIQHFEPVEYFGGQKQFERQQLHDKIKDDYCKEQGIKLIRIPYWEIDNIEQILTEELSELIAANNQKQ